MMKCNKKKAANKCTMDKIPPIRKENQRRKSKETETNNNIILELPRPPPEQSPSSTRIAEVEYSAYADCPDGITDQPPKKRQKIDTLELDDLTLPAVDVNGDSTEYKPDGQDCYKLESHQNNIANSISDTDETQTVIKTATENVNTNKNSSESSKITSSSDHEISQHNDMSQSPSNMLHSASASQTFCPLPSTSTNNQIFIRNDELFHKSLQEGSLNSSMLQEDNLHVSDNTIKSEQDIKNEEQATNVIESSITNDNEDKDLEIIEIPTETILILDDDIKDEPSTNIIMTGTINDESSQDHDDDDDCIFVDTQTSSHKPTPRVTDVIDLECDCIEPSLDIENSITNNIDDEIIDVDALIAQNQTILSQIKPQTESFDNTNLIVDVDATAITNNPNNNANMSTNEQISGMRTEDSRCNADVEDAFINTAINNTRAFIEKYKQRAMEERSRVQRHIRRRQNRLHTNNLENCHVISNQNGHGSTELNNIVKNVRDFFKNYKPPENLNTSNGPVNLDLPMFNVVLEPVPGRSGCHRTNNNSRSYFYLSLDVSHNKPAPKKKSAKKNDSKVISEGKTTLAQEKPSGKLGDCPICMETLSTTAIGSTICGHVFCMRCLKQAIATNKRCPTCRKLLKKNGYHQIYL